MTLFFVSTGEIPLRGIKKKRAVEWTWFFSHKLCMIEVLTTHSHQRFHSCALGKLMSSYFIFSVCFLDFFWKQLTFFFLICQHVFWLLLEELLCSVAVVMGISKTWRHQTLRDSREVHIVHLDHSWEDTGFPPVKTRKLGARKACRNV